MKEKRGKVKVVNGVESLNVILKLLTPNINQIDLTIKLKFIIHFYAVITINKSFFLSISLPLFQFQHWNLWFHLLYFLKLNSRFYGADDEWQGDYSNNSIYIWVDSIEKCQFWGWIICHCSYFNYVFSNKCDIISHEMN